MKFTIEQEADGVPRVVLKGSVTEEANFSELLEMAEGRRIRLDLAGIDQINSCGVREWIHFVTDLTSSGRSFEMHRCSPAIVRQLNMISNFRGGGSITSIMLPYYCDACGEEEERLLPLQEDGAPPVIDLEVSCECGEAAEFDDIPSSYLAFAAWQAPRMSASA